MSDYGWRTVDFRPVAVPGWRVFQLLAGGRDAVPLAGWLIRDEVETDFLGEKTVTDFREAVPAILTGDGDLEPATGIPGFWCILGPGDPDPSDEEEAAERVRRIDILGHLRSAQ